MKNEAVKTLGSKMAAELNTQPYTWRRASELAETVKLPAVGKRVAVIACGTPSFIGDSYARLREQAGHGETDNWLASAAPLHRNYDEVLAITRSGTTTEVLEAIASVRGRIPVTAIVGDPNTPIAQQVDNLIALPFADEESVVQTRFATTVLALLRASLGENIDAAIADCHAVLAEEIAPELISAEQISFLGTGWTVGLAHEAALKNREAAQTWAESYSAMDYRHGPISIAQQGRVSWMFGAAPEGLAQQVQQLGATWVGRQELDPLALLVLAQRVALERARARGLDADQPRGLTRSVILDSDAN